MVTVLIKTDGRYPVNRRAIRAAIGEVINEQRLGSLNAEISVMVCGARKMEELTRQYIGDGRVHEVLSFPFEDVRQRGAFVGAPDGVLRLGDIIVSWPEVVRLAGENDLMIDSQLSNLINHGMEHLLGKHHEE